MKVKLGRISRSRYVMRKLFCSGNYKTWVSKKTREKKNVSRPVGMLLNRRKSRI